MPFFEQRSDYCNLERLGFIICCWSLCLAIITSTRLWQKSPSFTLKQRCTHNLEGVIGRPLLDSGSLTHPPDRCSLWAGRSHLGEKNVLLWCHDIDFGDKSWSYLFCMLIYALIASGGEKEKQNNKTVSFRKFIIKAWRSMIMASVLVFVIFAQATVVEFLQIYLYTRAVSGV